VPINVQNQFLAVAVNLAGGILEYRQGRVLESRKRKRSKKDIKPESAGTSKRAKVVSSGTSNEAAETCDGSGSGSATISGEIEVSLGDGTAMDVEALAAEDRGPPSILQHLTIGINEVTRKLESQIKASRQTVVISDQVAVSSESLSYLGIKVVFVCRADIDPPMLIDHLPHLVSTCNSSRKPPDFVKLVPLPKGAEFTLAAALGLRRVAVIGVDVRQ
jgi:ribonuclease P/MRP protein subunit POP3